MALTATKKARLKAAKCKKKVDRIAGGRISAYRAITTCMIERKTFALSDVVAEERSNKPRFKRNPDHIGQGEVVKAVNYDDRNNHKAMASRSDMRISTVRGRVKTKGSYRLPSGVKLKNEY